LSSLNFHAQIYYKAIEAVFNMEHGFVLERGFGGGNVQRM